MEINEKLHMRMVDQILIITNQKVTVQVQVIIRINIRVHRATAGHQVRLVHRVHQTVCITKLTLLI